MVDQDHTDAAWTALNPPFRKKGKSADLFIAYARLLSRLRTSAEDDGAVAARINKARQKFIDSLTTSPLKDKPALLAAGLVLTDLVIQGWPIRIRNRVVEVRPPEAVEGNGASEKGRVRRQELVKRDAQLRQPATIEFIRSMERARVFGDGFVSIFSLMRDGRELANALREARKHNNNGWAEALSQIVDPYLQFVSENSRCALTGFRLIDIWRYFRHTWTNQYTSVPGRSMMFLVRDRAAPFHPVIGIGALCSPIMQIRQRDKWIGWHPEAFLSEINKNPTNRVAKWLVRMLDHAIQEIYVEDFIEDGLISARGLKQPTEKLIKELVAEGSHQRRLHHRFVRSREHKQNRNKSHNGDHWASRARTHLFRSKRALALAELLRVRALFLQYLGGQPTEKKLASLLETSAGRKAVCRIVRKVKADRVGIAVADISVCGAIQPYNAILGGKLVSMLAASAETVSEYRRRYSKAESEIASSMAGRPIIRSPNLVLLGTTSLYGVGSSQYNRIKIPCAPLGGRESEFIKFEELGYSEAFGTSQYSEETVSALVSMVQQSANGQRVNSIFGEGVSPKFRKVRQGLDMLGFPSAMLLRHYRHRVVYGISLVRNLREYLLGMTSRPDYLLPSKDGLEVSSRIAEWWRERWLRQRIQSDAVLQEVARHTHIRPMRHGARVPLFSLFIEHSMDIESVGEIPQEPRESVAQRQGARVKSGTKRLAYVE